MIDYATDSFLTFRDLRFFSASHNTLRVTIGGRQHNVSNNQQAGAVIELRKNGPQRNGRATQTPLRTVRVDWPCYVLMLKPSNVNNTFRQARPCLRTAPSGLLRLRILPSGRH